MAENMEEISYINWEMVILGRRTQSHKCGCFLFADYILAIRFAAMGKTKRRE